MRHIESHLIPGRPACDLASAHAYPGPMHPHHSPRPDGLQLCPACQQAELRMAPAELKGDRLMAAHRARTRARAGLPAMPVDVPAPPPTRSSQVHLPFATPESRARNLAALASPVVPHRFGDGPGVTITGHVARSGTTVGITATTSGVNTPITAFRSGDNVQELTLAGTPAGSSFTLTFNGHTTSAIPIASGPPLAYGLWTIPTTSGHSYTIQGTWDGTSGEPSAQLFEPLRADAVTPLASGVSVNMTATPSGTTDGTRPDSQPQVWQTILTVIAADASIKLRVSSPVGQVVAADGLRVVDNNTSAVQHLDDADSAHFAMTPSGMSGTGSAWYSGTYTLATGTGAGPRYTVDPAAIRTALLALPNVQAGGVVVTAADNIHSSPYVVHFTGPMAGTSQPTITSSDSAIVPSVLNAGGDYPTLTVNWASGGSSTYTLTNPNWGPGLNLDGTVAANPYWPCVEWYLPLSSPVTQFVSAYGGLFGRSGQDANGTPGYTNPTFNVGPSNFATAVFPNQPTGTYKLSVTYQHGSGLSTAASYHVTMGPVGWLQGGAGGGLSASYQVSGGTPVAGSPFTVDQTQAAADFTDAGVGWKTIQTGITVPASLRGTDIAVMFTVPSGTATFDAIRLDRTSSDATVLIGPDDAAFLSATEGWASDAAGPLPALTNLPLSNHSGGTMLPAVTGTQSMKMAYNIAGDYFGGSVRPYANLAKGIQIGVALAEADSNGYPIKCTLATLDILVAGFVDDAGGKGHGLPAVPGGNYWFGSDGTSPVVPFGGGDSTATVVGTPVTGQSTGNHSVYTCTNGPSTVSPSIGITIHPISGPDGGGLYTYDIRNLQIYPPGIDPAAPPKWLPSYLAMIPPGVGALRFLDPSNVISGNIVDPTDLVQVSDASYFDQRRVITASVVSVTGYVPANGIFAPFDNINLQVNFSAPHGLTSGQVCELIAPNGEHFTCSDSSTYPLNGIFGVVHVPSSTTIVMRQYANGGSTTVSGTVTPTGATVTCGVGGGGMPFVDAFDLCQATNSGAGCSVHWPIPITASDVTVGYMATYAATHTPIGHKFILEPVGNEDWNFSFPTYPQCCLLNALNGGGYNYYPPGYILRASHVIPIFEAAFAAVGRSADLVRCLASQGGNSGLTGALATLAAASSLPVDALLTANYWSNQSALCGLEPTLADLNNGLTAPRLVDHFELVALHGKYGFVNFAEHRGQLDNAGYTSALLYSYEGGGQDYVPDTVTDNFARRNHAVARHPGTFGITVAMLADSQANGCVLFDRYLMTNSIGNAYGGAQWGDFWYTGQQPGTGSMTADALNVSDPESAMALSEAGGGHRYFAGLSGGGGTSPPPPPPPPSSGRVASRRARLLRRVS